MEMHVPSDEGAVSEVLSDEQRDAVIDGLRDRTPADVTVEHIRSRGTYDTGRSVTTMYLCGCVLRPDTAVTPGWSLCPYHQGYDAGFRVVPIPDDNTRSLAADLLLCAYVWEDTIGSRWALPVRAAAAYLDGQPEDRPPTCPTCDSDEDWYDKLGPGDEPCSDPWHVGGSGDTR